MSIRSHRLIAYLALGCGFVLPYQADADPGRREDRAALFAYLFVKTMEREAFSEIKNETLGLDIARDMLELCDELIAADTNEKLYYTLAKISNVRKDRHLGISLVPGGLTLEKTAGVRKSDYREDDPKEPILHAPIRFAVDYGTPGHYFLFVSDYPKDIEQYAGQKCPEVGDKLTGINDQPIADYFQAVKPYHRYSTVTSLWSKFALWIPQKSYQFPPHLYREKVTFQLEDCDGQSYYLTLPYLDSDEIEWEGHGTRRYEGFSLVFETQTFDLYQSNEAKPVLLLSWHGFHEDLRDDVDHLMDYAAENRMLDHAIIWDGTRSRGGSKGAYAIRRLSPRTFNTTFGNLRISDVTPRFVEEKHQEFERGEILDSGVSETVDDGSWLMDWLEGDVMKAVRAGQSYTTNVPFKLAHLPKWSDGIVRPAKVHFRGPMVCLLGPYGGSHLDQFAAIVVDNDLAYTIGMPTGGYSNTWEWEETLVFPLSKKPVVKYMWSIGQTIRPNGEVLEGNPAKVHEYIPVTSDNYLTYYTKLLSRASEHLNLE